jgi:hypothetical protein
MFRALLAKLLNKPNQKCITLVSLYGYTVMHGQQNIKHEICRSCPQYSSRSETRNLVDIAEINFMSVGNLMISLDKWVEHYL